MSRKPSQIEREIRQTRPFASRGAEALVGLVHTADVIKRRFESVFGPHGITGQQYNVLRILRGAGKAGLPTLDIADRMIEQAPGITRLIDRLERRGWVRRERGDEDRRVVRCHISAAGLKLLDRLDAPVLAFDKGAVSALKGAELGRLIELLDRIRAAPEGAAGP